MEPSAKACLGVISSLNLCKVFSVAGTGNIVPSANADTYQIFTKVYRPLALKVTECGVCEQQGQGATPGLSDIKAHSLSHMLYMTEEEGMMEIWDITQMEKPEPPSSEFLERNRILGFRDSPLILSWFALSSVTSRRQVPVSLWGALGAVHHKSLLQCSLGMREELSQKATCTFPETYAATCTLGRREGGKGFFLIPLVSAAFLPSL